MPKPEFDGVSFCLQQKAVGTGCLKCKAGFVEYRDSNGDIKECNPIVKGCIIFDYDSPDPATNKPIFGTSKCVKCAPGFTEVVIFLNGKIDF